MPSQSKGAMASTRLDELKVALADRYFIDREIESGGMATVYLARDIKHDRLVALKVLREELAAVITTRFLREIRLAAQFSHPHIVALHDSGMVGNTLYYVMPYIEGESLRAAIDKRGAFPTEEAVRITTQIGDALSYAHERGVVHRDVKPANVLLYRGEAMLTDFGIARPVEADEYGTTSVGFAVGTPAYMSPEQAIGDGNVDGRTDQYSLARVTCEMLSGKQGAGFGIRDPFEGWPPSSRAPPSRVAAVLRKALSTDPGERYPTIAFFVHDLVEASHRAGSRWRTTLVGGSLVTLALGGAGVGGWLAIPKAKRALLETVVSRPETKLNLRRIVVAPFEDVTNDSTLRGIGRLSADVVAAQLTSAGTGEVVDGHTALFTSKLLDQLPRVLVDRNSAVALGREVSAGRVISGAVYLVADSLRIRAELLDAGSGRVLRSIDEISGSRQQVSELLRRLGQRVGGALAIELDPKYNQTGSVWATPPNLRSYEATTKAFEAYYRGDDEQAIELFDAAIALDSTYPTPVLLYAYFRATLYEYPALDTLLNRAETLDSRFSVGERLLYENLRCRLRGDSECVLRTATALMEASPASAEIPTMVAANAVYLNRPGLAIAALKRTDPRRGLLLVNPTYWRWLTAARHELGEFDQEVETAAQALRQFPDNGMLKEIQIRALAAAGREGEVGRLLRLDAEVGDRRDWRRESLAYTAYRQFIAHGHGAAARRMADTVRAITVVTAGDTSRQSQINRVGLLYDIGEWRLAVIALERLARRSDIDRDEWFGYHGGAAAHLNERGRAEAYVDSLAALDPSVTHGLQQVWRARILAVLGSPDEAVEALHAAMRQGWSGWFREEWGGLDEEPDFASLKPHTAFRRMLIPDQTKL
jgi:tetratricopeptide (TPR) repeat protein